MSFTNHHSLIILSFSLIKVEKFKACYNVNNNLKKEQKKQLRIKVISSHTKYMKLKRNLKGKLNRFCTKYVRRKVRKTLLMTTKLTDFRNLHFVTNGSDTQIDGDRLEDVKEVGTGQSIVCE
jgi:hypothetical protein